MKEDKRAAMSNSDKKIQSLSKRSGRLIFIKKGPILIVSLIPPLIVVILVLIWILMKGKFFQTLPEIYTDFFLLIMSLILGSVGVIYIYRKEMPGPVPSATIRGTWAVITGCILLLFFWLLGILGFISALLGHR
jgi:hypothetical protein